MNFPTIDREYSDATLVGHIVMGGDGDAKIAAIPISRTDAMELRH